MGEIVLYEYNFDKPELSEELLMHYGVKGMRWGVRRYQNYDGSRIKSGGKKVINKTKMAMSKHVTRKAQRKKDKIAERKRVQKHKDEIAYMSRHPDKYSTKDINDKLNRINAESRLSDMNRQLNPTTGDKVKKILSDKRVKAAAAVAIGALLVTGTVIATTKIKNDKAYKEALDLFIDGVRAGNRLPDFSNPQFNPQYPEKTGIKRYLKAAKNTYANTVMNMGIAKTFQSMGLGEYAKEILNNLNRR